MPFSNSFYALIASLTRLQPIIFGITVVVFVFSRIANNWVLSSKKNFNENGCSLDTVIKYINEMLKGFSSESIDIKYGSFYAFDRIKQCILLKKKENYSFLETFVCFHEAAHCIDSQNKKMNPIYKLNEFISVLGLLFFLITFVYFIVLLISSGLKITGFYYLFIITITFFSLKMIIIPILEIRANIIAKKYMFKKKLLNKYTKKSMLINFNCVTAILDQISINIIFLTTIILMFHLYISITF